MSSRRRCWSRRSPSTRTTARRRARRRHPLGAYMGWADMTTALQIAERAARAAVQADNEDPWAHHALGSVYLLTRRFDNSLAEFELALRLNPDFRSPRAYLARPRLLRPLGGGRQCFPPCAAVEPARSVISALLWHCLTRSVRWTQLRRGDPAGARSNPVSRRLCRWPPPAHQRSQHGGTDGSCQSRAPGAAPRAAQYFPRLDRKRIAVQAGSGPSTLFGSVPPCGLELAIEDPSQRIGRPRQLYTCAPPSALTWRWTRADGAMRPRQRIELLAGGWTERSGGLHLPRPGRRERRWT